MFNFDVFRAADFSAASLFVAKAFKAATSSRDQDVVKSTAARRAGE
jgi:hypothetical protein